MHGRFNGLGLPTKFVLTPGQAADVTQAEALLDGVEFDAAIADRGFDKQALVDAIEARGAEAVIPARRNRVVQRGIDTERYKDRNLAERCWARLKVFRRVATRYDKTARNFLAFLHLASITILLK